MPLVHTTLGLLDRDQLEVKDIVSETDNSRCIRTEWYYQGQLVRADGHVAILRTQAIGGEQAAL